VSRIYWDTMLFVYWLEDHPMHATRVKEIYDGMRRRHDILCASSFTLAELLIGPLKRRAADTADNVRVLFRSPAVEVSAFTLETAERYAHIRATQRVSPPDAIHLASAAQSGADLFLTNDHRLQGLVIPGIHFITGMNTNLF
jgi:uncharacterized protein